ncbi:putative tatC-like protein ycf43 [Clarias magur]|uniref:Putative tatC-like protein ycf43 n=1 Tax=Clarias magur TaxID=1594786 RepID=A0A8J4TS97_CLAMG|nr:putative tatC-like protein ycf43 [Clarias magur]
MADDVLRDSQARPRSCALSCRWLKTDYSLEHLGIREGSERLEQSTDWASWDFSLGAKEAISCQTFESEVSEQAEAPAAGGSEDVELHDSKRRPSPPHLPDTLASLSWFHCAFTTCGLVEVLMRPNSGPPCCKGYRMTNTSLLVPEQLCEDHGAINPNRGHCQFHR